MLNQKNRIRLRSENSISRDEIIQKNLMPMQENISKKKIAQAHYYDKRMGQNPFHNYHDENIPVHNRLGVFKRNRRKVPLFGTNTNALLPKNKLNYYKVNKRKKYSAQDRLNRIRQQQIMNQKPIIFTASYLRRLLLRRYAPSHAIKVLNENKQTEIHSRFKLYLNPVYQEEIRQIQITHPRQIIHGLYPIIPVATNITLNYRFTHLL